MSPRFLAVLLFPVIGFSQPVREREALALAVGPSGQVAWGGSGRAWVAMASPSGQEIFRIQAGQSAADRVSAVAFAPDGTIVAAGEQLADGRPVGFAVSVSAEGVILSRHSFRKPMRAVAAAPDGSVYVAGEQEAAKLGVWTRTVPGPVNALAVTQDGRLFAGGSKAAGVDTGSNGTDGWVAALDPVAGEFGPLVTIGGTGARDEVRALAIDPADGSVYAAGSTDSGDFPARDGWQSAFQGTLDAFVAK